jgi:hypothetical protein
MRILITLIFFEFFEVFEINLTAKIDKFRDKNFKDSNRKMRKWERNFAYRYIVLALEPLEQVISQKICCRHTYVEC